MNKGNLNNVFLNKVDAKSRDAILNSIAKHYGISKDEALDEVIHEDAESILDYMVGAERIAVGVLMKRHGLF